MNDFVSRYYRRKTWSLEAKTLTPLFLGGAHQGAEWRAAPFKSLLRYWWRLAQGPEMTLRDLQQEESRLFGSAGGEEGEGGQSLVRVGVISETMPEVKPLKTNLKIPYPKFPGKGVEALLYLAGMGLLDPQGKVKEPHSYFPVDSVFIIKVDCTKEDEAEVKKTLALVQAFGALGSRCRNGWGNFRITCGGLSKEEALEYLHQFTQPWQDGFSRDYPTCLGQDKKGPLLWKTKIQKSWEEAMRDLADAYAGLRARTVDSVGPLDADGKTEPSERHLLGFPLTNHPAETRTRQGWGNDGRHASPLRFVVRRRPQGFAGFMLHVPHRFSDEMTRGIDALKQDKQLEVWKKVHRKLDHLLQRAAYEECL